MINKQIKLKLEVDITYSLNGESPELAVDYLTAMINTAFNRGLLTGDSAIEVEDASVKVYQQ